MWREDCLADKCIWEEFVRINRMPDTPDDPSASLPPAGHSGDGAVQKHILVIDDDDMVCSFIRKALEMSGYAVSVASNGYEAMVIFRKSKLDGIITDLLMPERDGIETILEIRRHAPEIPIVAISGGFNSMSSVYLKTAEHLGADAVLSKPFSVEQLLAALESSMK
jgi:DNA-binding response OmpR family regulator